MVAVAGSSQRGGDLHACDPQPIRNRAGRPDGRLVRAGTRVTGGSPGVAATGTDGRGAGRSPSPSRRVTGLALGAWLGLLVVARVWGLRVVADAPEPIFVDAVPFYGLWEPLITWRWGLAVLVALGGVAFLPRMLRLRTWGSVLGVVAVAAALWTLALAFVEPSAIAWRNIYGDYGQYLPLVDAAGPGGFLRDYVASQPTLPTHLSAHPPGMMVLLWALARVGLEGMAVDAGLAVLAVSVSSVAVLVALRDLGGEDRARRAAPFVVLAPAAIWHTNADVVFGAFALGGVCLFVLASSRHGRRGDVLAAGAGVLLAAGAFMSYGLVLFAVPVLVLAVGRRRLRPLLIAAAAVFGIVLVALAWGFWWLGGLEATKVAYDGNLARVRPYGYFLLANLAVLAAALGPATAVALTRLRDRATWLLVGGGLGAIALADVSGMSLAETERIWQPFMPLVLLAGAALVPVGALERIRPWLAAQAVVALGLVAVLRSPW